MQIWKVVVLKCSEGSGLLVRETWVRFGYFKAD